MDTSRKRTRSCDSDEIDTSVSVAYIHSNSLLVESSKTPNIGKRAKMVHHLIKAYGLLDFVKVIEPKLATAEQLSQFHSSSYVDYILSLRNESEEDDASNHSSTDESSEDESDCDEETNEEFGIGYDCPPLKNLFQYVSHMAGSTLTAANTLINGEADVVINWCGGWHHAQRDEAEGFCYVNDIVLGIQELRKKFEYVLYIDFDIHHGNGVENAFAFTRKVFTLSIHKYEPGFYPGTGSLDDIGIGNGKYHSLNIPLKTGISDEPYISMFQSISEKVFAAFQPDCIVVQCGADCITGDKLGDFNLTPKALGLCIKHILSWKRPVMVLGGGGYNLVNTAKCWTYLTSVILAREIPSEIPEHKYFTLYGPDFDLEITPSHRKDCNTKDELGRTVIKVTDLMNKLRNETLP